MQVSPLIKPETTDQMTLIQWHLCYPIHYAAQKTMPDCKSEQYRNWYPFTFMISMIWISFYSYIMVWMITIIGNTSLLTSNYPIHYVTYFANNIFLFLIMM